MRTRLVPNSAPRASVRIFSALGWDRTPHPFRIIALLRAFVYFLGGDRSILLSYGTIHCAGFQFLRSFLLYLLLLKMSNYIPWSCGSEMDSTATATAWLPFVGWMLIRRAKECTTDPSGIFSSKKERLPCSQHAFTIWSMKGV